MITKHEHTQGTITMWRRIIIQKENFFFKSRAVALCLWEVHTSLPSTSSQSQFHPPSYHAAPNIGFPPRAPQGQSDDPQVWAGHEVPQEPYCSSCTNMYSIIWSFFRISFSSVSSDQQHTLTLKQIWIVLLMERLVSSLMCSMLTAQPLSPIMCAMKAVR